MKKFVLGQVGQVNCQVERHDDALETLHQALELSVIQQDIEYESIVCCLVGAAQYSLGKYEKATEYSTRSLRICLQRGDLSGMGKALGNIGNVYNSRAKYEDALNCYEEAAKMFRETGKLMEEREMLSSKGVVYVALGEYDKALECYKDVLRKCEETDDMRGEGAAFGKIGVVYESLGDIFTALECYKRCLQIAVQRKDQSGMGAALNNIGSVHQSLREYQQAMKCYKSDLHICQQTGNPKGQAMALCNIGAIYTLLEEDDQAKRSYDDALKILEQTGDFAEEAALLSNMGSLSLLSLDFAAAEVNLKRSVSCYEKIFSMLGTHSPSKVSIVDTYINTYQTLTFLLVELEKTEEALMTSEKGRSRALRDKLFDKYVMEPGSAAAHDVRYTDTRSLLSSDASNFVMYSLTPISCFFIFATSAEGSANVDGLSQDELADLVKGHPGTEIQTVFEKCVKKIILHAQSYVHQNRENTFEDRSMGQTESYQVVLRGHLRGEAKEPFHKTLESVTKLEIVEENRNEESQNEKEERASDGDGDGDSAQGEDAPGQEIPQGKDNPCPLDSSVVNCCLLHKCGSDLLKDLYQALIAPIESKLDQQELVIIPDGPLFLVPFAALQAPDGTFLSETKQIRIGPSLTTLKILEVYPLEKQSKSEALIVGGPCVRNVMRFGEFAEGPFEDLPYAWKEAVDIGKLVKEKPLIAFKATKDVIMRGLRQGVALIHIATHGSGETGELLFAPGPRPDQSVPTEEDYMLTVKEICECNINAQLVVLSCCHTGSGKIRAEGVMSLARAFLVAGARSVLATLWQVSDQGTLYFMNSFYRHLTSGKSACTSLQEAMREMRAIPRWSHWSYWASFFIIGHDVTPF